MPHLSPIIWTLLYVLVWLAFVVLVVNFEFVNFSLRRY